MAPTDLNLVFAGRAELQGGVSLGKQKVGSWPARHGLVEGDVLTRVGEHVIIDTKDLKKFLREHKNDRTTMRVERTINEADEQKLPAAEGWFVRGGPQWFIM